MTSEQPLIQPTSGWVGSTSENGTEIDMSLDNPPIEKRCGFETIDTITVGLLVLAPLETVAEVVAQSGVRWERNVYNKSIQGRGLVIFQFRGHAWTGILDGLMTDKYRDVVDGSVSAYWDWELQAQSFSLQLHTRTIYYLVDDSGGNIHYVYWENGTLMERLEFDEAIWQDNHDEALLDTPERTFEPHLFESQLRQLTAPEIKNTYAFVDDFLCEQQAYAATRLSSFNFQPDDFVRVDYIAFA